MNQITSSSANRIIHWLIQQAYFLWLSQALTTPMDPPLPGGTKRYQFWLAPRNGGGFHGRSQSLTEPKKECRLPKSLSKIQRKQIPQTQSCLWLQTLGYSALLSFAKGCGALG